jgi:nucleoid-associated protein YgaU
MRETGNPSNPDFSDVNPDSSSTSSGRARNPDFSDVEGGSSSTATPADAAGGRTYTVKSGDNLRKIAQHFYGDEMKWHKIRDANRAKLPNPDQIQAGMQLTIPDA